MNASRHLAIGLTVQMGLPLNLGQPTHGIFLERFKKPLANWIENLHLFGN